MRKYIYKIILLILSTNTLSANEKISDFQFTALPNASYKDSEGFALGGQMFLFQYGDGRVKPYEWRTATSFKISNEGMASGYIFLDRPNFWGKNSRLQLYAEYNRNRFDDYYGLGNTPYYNANLIEPNHADYKNENYYSFKQQRPGIRATFQMPSRLAHTRHSFGFGVSSQKVDAYVEANRLLEDLAVGFAGGITSLLQYGLIYDTRDQEAGPTSGAWSDVLAEYASPIWGSDYNYVRLTLTDRRYISLGPRIVYAQRFIFEPIFGDVPFYDMAIINSSYRRQRGLGGSTSLRGVPRLLFVGQHKILGNFELRFETYKTRMLKQDLTFYIHTFLDVGRVWLKNEKLTLEDVRNSYGAGLHIRWRKDLIGAIDIGRSQYSSIAIYITFENLF
jgi:outer membrane protein assembly factor BamA